MTAPSVRSLSFSLLLHATFLGALALFLTSQQEKITLPLSSLFTLVPSLDAPVNSRSAETSRPISVTLPVAPPTARSAPTPAPDTIPAPTKSIPAPTRPAAPKAPVRLTEKEFRRLNGSTQTPARPVAQPTTTPHVSENFSPAQPSSTGSTSKNSSAASADDLSFTPSLLRDLRAAFVSDGISTIGLSAVVEFTFNEVGIFNAVRVVRPSGDPTFDAAVLAAFTQVRARGFPPEAAGQSYRVTFQITST